MIEFKTKLKYTDRLICTVPDELKKIVEGYCIKNKNKEIKIKLSKISKNRTTGEKSQNNHFHGHVQQIAMATGNDFELVKYTIKQIATKRGYPLKRDENGIPVLDIRGDIQGEDSKNVSMSDFSLLIDECHQLAAEYNIRLVEE